VAACAGFTGRLRGRVVTMVMAVIMYGPDTLSATRAAVTGDEQAHRESLMRCICDDVPAGGTAAGQVSETLV
jgi:hypothetical protein